MGDIAQKKILWIAWDDDGSIRSKVLANEIKADFCAFTKFEGRKYFALPRYFLALFQTFLAISRKKPEILFIQNPSAVLSFFAAVIKPFFGYYLVIDLHTLCLSEKGIKAGISTVLNRHSLKKGDLIIVTNGSYKHKIKKITNKEIFVLPDKIPLLIYESKKLKLKGKKNVLYICSFSEDEPWAEVVKAGKLVDNGAHIYITGKHEKRIDKKKLPKNVSLTGYLPYSSYQNLMESVDSVIVLTTKEGCLLCGAYEAVAVETPLILSDKKELRKYFNRGVIFTKNNADSIAESINTSLKNRACQQSEIRKLKEIRNKEWKKQWACLMGKMQNK